MEPDRKLLELTYLPPGGVGGLGADVTLVATDADPTLRDEPDAWPYTLQWSDRVANVWTEHYADLAVALVRTATLLRAIQRDELFRHRAGDAAQTVDGCPGPAEFTHDALTFLDDQLSGG